MSGNRFRIAILLSILLVFQSGCQSVFVAPSRKREIHTLIARYQEAVNRKSEEKLSALLAETIRIDGMTDELSRAGLKAGMHWPSSPFTNFQVLSLSKEDGLFSVKVAFYFQRSVLLMRFGIDDRLKITTLDAIPLWKVPETRITKPFTVSFTERQGLPFVQASVNGRTGFFLLDTGSSGLLLNTKYFQAEKESGLPGFTSTVHGIQTSGRSKTAKSFQWGQLRIGEIRGQLHDFSALESPPITPLLGAIGHEQLKTSAVRFDWRNKQIAVRPGNTRTMPSENRGGPATVIGFTPFLHAPAFPVKIGNSTRKMLFDSGAQINLLPNLDGLDGHFRKSEDVTRISDGGTISKETVWLGQVDEVQVGGLPFNDLPFAVFAVPYLDGHGILGTPLLQRCLVEINFPRKTISIWKPLPDGMRPWLPAGSPAR